MTDNQLPPLPTPKFTETIRGVPCITVTEHEHMMRTYALQARAQVQGEPFAWVEHHKGGDNLVWDEPGGRKSPLYTTPQPAQAAQAEVTDEKILSLDCVSIDSDEHGTSFWVDRSTVIKFARAILALRHERVPMTDEPQWIVNDIGELGVRVGGRFFFLYKGGNIEYGKDGMGDSQEGIAMHDDGTPMHYRIVGKREFGETCWPLKWVTRGHSERRYTEQLVFTKGLSFGCPEDGDWKPLPSNVRAAAEIGKETP